MTESEMYMTAKMKALASALALCSAFSTFSAHAAVDAKLPDYSNIQHGMSDEDIWNMLLDE